MLDKKNIFNINHLILYFLIFNFFFIILRIILPLGDEADYFHRYQFSIFNFENLNYLYRDDYNSSISCNKARLVGGIFEPLMKISPFFCTITINEFFERVIFGFLINIIYFFLIFIFYSNQTILNLLNISDKNKNNNLHIFFCSIIYPSVIYFLGSRSNEVFLFYLTIFFFLCWKNIFVSLVIAFLAILIDKGNGYIFLLFLCFFYFFRYLNEFIKLKYIIIINLFLIIILIFFEDHIRVLFLNIFGNFENSYTKNFFKSVFGEEKNFLLPNFYKLIITYLSFIFFTPGYLKSTLLIIMMSILILIISYKILKKYLLKKFEDQKEENIYDYYLNFFLTINFIIIVVLIFPTHSFIRYYFFIYPFVFSIIFIEFGMKKTLLISIIACLLISIETILFRLLYFV